MSLNIQCSAGDLFVSAQSVLNIDQVGAQSWDCRWLPHFVTFPSAPQKVSLSMQRMLFATGYYNSRIGYTFAPTPIPYPTCVAIYDISPGAFLSIVQLALTASANPVVTVGPQFPFVSSRWADAGQATYAIFDSYLGFSINGGVFPPDVVSAIQTSLQQYSVFSVLLNTSNQSYTPTHFCEDGFSSVYSFENLSSANGYLLPLVIPAPYAMVNNPTCTAVYSASLNMVVHKNSAIPNNVVQPSAAPLSYSPDYSEPSTIPIPSNYLAGRR